MGAAVEPYDAVDAESPVQPDRLGDPLHPIVLGVYDQRVRAPELIRSRMRRALMLGDAEPRARGAFRLANPGLVEGEAHVVADLGPGASIVEVLVTEQARVIPCAGEVHLSGRDRYRTERKRDKQFDTSHRLLSACGKRQRRPTGRRI